MIFSVWERICDEGILYNYPTEGQGYYVTLLCLTCQEKNFTKTDCICKSFIMNILFIIK